MKNLYIVSIFLMTLVVGCVSTDETPVVDNSELAKEYYNLGNAYFELKDYSKASNYYLKALSYDETLKKAEYNLARAYIEYKRFEDALIILEELLKDDPENLLILKTMAYAYYLNGERDEALARYELVLLKAENDQNSLFNSAIIELEVDKKYAARNKLKQLNELSQEDSAVLLQLGDIHYDLALYEDSAENYKKYLKIKPRDGNVHLKLADVYEIEEYFSKAIEEYDAVLALEGEDANDTDAGLIHFKKAVLYLTEIEDYEEGKDSLEAAIKAGFNDKKKIIEFLERPFILKEKEIRTILRDNDLMPTGDDLE